MVSDHIMGCGMGRNSNCEEKGEKKNEKVKNPYNVT